MTVMPTLLIASNMTAPKYDQYPPYAPREHEYLRDRFDYARTVVSHDAHECTVLPAGQCRHLNR